LYLKGLRLFVSSTTFKNDLLLQSKSEIL